MAEMKLHFTIKVDAKVPLTSEEAQSYKEFEASGKEILLVEELKNDIADEYGIDVSCVQVLEHGTELIEEGTGE